MPTPFFALTGSVLFIARSITGNTVILRVFTSLRLLLRFPEYFVGIVVSDILRLIRYDLDHSVLPVIPFTAPDEITVFVDPHHRHPVLVKNRVAIPVIFLAAERVPVNAPCLQEAVNKDFGADMEPFEVGDGIFPV